MLRMEQELRELRKQVTGPTLTDVASTTRLERVPAPPVQTQESALTALITVVKDQMLEQSAWNRESMALMHEQRQVNQALLTAILGRVHKYFSQTNCHELLVAVAVVIIDVPHQSASGTCLYLFLFFFLFKT